MRRRRATLATPGEWQCKTGGVRRLAVANGPNIVQMFLVYKVIALSVLVKRLAIVSVVIKGRCRTRSSNHVIQDGGNRICVCGFQFLADFSPCDHILNILVQIPCTRWSTKLEIEI